MAQYTIECPVCGRPVQASTGLFAQKTIKCVCGYNIDTNIAKIATKKCPHCGNTVTYDRSKSKAATCPVCHKKINEATKTIRFTCPACKKELHADEHAQTFTCPQCKTLIDVQARVAQEASSGKTSIVEWDMGQNDIFVYRHPVEKFNIGSQLIVHEGQKALFFRDGRGLDLFGPGRYTLETQRLPLMNGIFDIATGSTATFDSKVYFIKTNRLKVLWGVPKITLEDRGLGFHVDLGFSGSFEMQVKEDDESARKLVYRIMGTTSGIKHEEPVGGGEVYNAEYISEKFRDIVVTHISDLMYNIIKENNINILEIDSKKIAIADILRQKINIIFDDYGLIIPPNLFTIPNMRVHNLEDVQKWKAQQKDKVFRVREAENELAEAQAAKGYRLVETETDQQVKIMTAQGDAESIRITGQAEADVYRAQAQAEADEMKAKGYTYQQESAREIGVAAMKNGLPGTGGSGGSSIAGDLLGLGVAMGTVEEVSGLVKEAITPSIKELSTGSEPIVTTQTWTCSCGEQNITTNFCPQCGSPKPVLWTCPDCGTANISSRFCPNCGSKRPELAEKWTCPNCGTKDINSKFCPECGRKRG